MELFDTHCHLDDEKFDSDREEAFARMGERGVKYCTCVGSDLPSSERCIEFAQGHPGVFAACGIHPHEAKDAPSDYLQTLENMLRQGKVRALGEIGLDYYYDLSPRDTQKRVLNEQLDLALQLDLPVIFHIRDAHGDMLELLKGRKRNPPAVVHCFSGSPEVASEYLKMGFYISFAGPLTFKKAPHLVSAAGVVPLDRVLVETDSPYLSPEPLRGRRNEPANVFYVCERLAQIKGIPMEEMAQITRQNAFAFYRISPDNL